MQLISNFCSYRTADDLGDVSKIMEIKILLSLPEQIWVTIDNKNYLLGAELFLFATHIHFGINMSPNAKQIKEEYPVVSKQWEIIISYRNILISGAHNELKQIDLSYEVCYDSYISVYHFLIKQLTMIDFYFLESK